jgi:hypothetical protein
MTLTVTSSTVLGHYAKKRHSSSLTALYPNRYNAFQRQRHLKETIMNTIPFDTLQIANRLKAAGFTDEQAAVITEIQRETSHETLQQAIHDYHLDDVATKRDLKELENNLDHKIELLRADTGRLIAETKADLTRWIIGAGFLQTTLIIGVLLKLAKLI